MGIQNVFKRYEIKYLINLKQKEAILKAMQPYMELDEYGRTTIRNLYYDNDDYLLIRRSMDKPIYKEKLRVRSYQQASNHTKVFVEVKKKYEGIVYKRRLAFPYQEALNWLKTHKCSNNKQIAHEISYFLDYYQNLHPAMFLAYDREAYYSKDGSDFRVTFDDQIIARIDNLSLSSKVYGTSLLDEGMVLMEIKCSKGMPLWMSHILTYEKVYKTSFSKYGTAYTKLVFNPNHQCKKVSNVGGS